jgi:tetratricopeptide (TPR) repeat protein
MHADLVIGGCAEARPLDAVVPGVTYGHYVMSFVRRKRGQVLLVHNERVTGSSRVRQREIHRFTSPSELEDVLTQAGWTRWTRALAWRESEIEFDWPALRERLSEELKTWGAAPSGAKHRRNQKIERLASELVVELAPLSLAKVSDAAVVERVRPSLIALRDSIARLLPSEHKPEIHPPAKETNVIHLTPVKNPAADDTFDEGMEHWWAGNRRRAVTSFRRALELDPQHADAHNHLGIVSLEARKLKAAEQHFRAAIDGGQRHLEREGAEVHWGFIENRPYLRGLANLALVLAEQKKWAEALAIHKQMLKLNPNDNQGVRYLIGPECLRGGDDDGAIEAFQKSLHEEVGCAFGLALAKLRAHGSSAEIGEALLTGFAANRYVAPMLLGETWERLDAFHGTSMAEPEWAHDVIVAQADLWQAVARGAELLRFWWAAPPVATWRRKLDEIMLRLKDLAPSNERSALVSDWSALRSEETVRELVRTVRTAS